MNAIGTIWLFAAALLPGLSKKLRNDTLDKLEGVATLFERLGTFLKDGLLDKLMPRTRAPIIHGSTLQAAFEKVFAHTNNAFQTAVQGLRVHAASVARTIERDDDLRAWRMFGYFFQLAFLALFAYADLIQVINNLALIFPQDVPHVPDYLQNLTLSLLMSSVGIAIAAGFILAEFGEITHFGGWSKLKGSLRNVVYALVWFCLISVLAIDAVLAISRIRSIPDVARMLPQQTLDQLILWASTASSLVIIPMIIVTVLFLQGFVGLAVIYIAVIWLLSLGLELLHLVFVALVSVFTIGISYLLEFALKTLLWVLLALLFILGWTLAGAGITFEKVFQLVQAVLNLFYFPLDTIVGWIGRLFNKPA
ncbi:MAG: hypothetical protein WC935_09840 [Thermoleophilia bacterium]